MGLGADPPSACPHDRARRRALVRRHQLDILPSGLPPPVRVLSRLFRRLFLEGPAALQGAGNLAFFGDLVGLAETAAFATWLAPLRKLEWVVYAKPPFGGPEAVLAYLSRYTHRIAISNNRLVSADADTVAFRWKDHRIKNRDRQKVMRLATDEFIRRFLLHSCRTDSTASATTGYSPATAAGATSRPSATHPALAISQNAPRQQTGWPRKPSPIPPRHELPPDRSRRPANRRCTRASDARALSP